MATPLVLPAELGLSFVGPFVADRRANRTILLALTTFFFAVFYLNTLIIFGGSNEPKIIDQIHPTFNVKNQKLRAPKSDVGA